MLFVTASRRRARANATRGTRACPSARATAASAGCCTAGTRASRPCWPENTVTLSTKSGRSCSQCFWKKRWPPMPSGMRIIVSGRSARCGSDVRRHLREVAQQVALGERGLLQRRVRGPVDAVEVRELDAVRAHGEREGGSSCCRAGRGLRMSSPRRRGSQPGPRERGLDSRLRGTRSSHRGRRAAARTPAPAVRRRRSSAWKLTSATSFGSTHVVGAFSSGSSAKGMLCDRQLLEARLQLRERARRRSRSPRARRSTSFPLSQ